MRVGAVFVIFALVVTVCRGFNHDVSDAARWFLYGTCGCVEHVSTGQSVATCQVDAVRPMPDKFSYLGSNNCVNGYVPVCGKVFTVCYCLCKLAPTTTTAPSTNPGTVTTPAPPTTERFCQLGTTFHKMSCSAGDPCATDTNCFDVCTVNDENSIAACFCENTSSFPFGHVGEQCDAGQRCNSNGRCIDVCPTGDPNCVCPAGRSNTVDCYCENLSGNTITSCKAGEQCNSNGNCQDPLSLPTCSNGMLTMDCMCGSSPCNSGDRCDVAFGCTPQCTNGVTVPLFELCVCNNGLSSCGSGQQCDGTDCISQCEVTSPPTPSSMAKCFCDSVTCTIGQTCDLTGTGSCT